MQHSATVSFESFNSYKSSCVSPSPGLVQTNSGHLHYVERRVTLGLQTLKENESTMIMTDDFSYKPKKQTRLKSPRRTKSENNLQLQTVHKVGEYLGFLNKAPVFGEQRTVIMDMQWTKFGFQLQSYGRNSNRGKQQQTIVQNVTIGSPAFMAGLHQGDAIIEINSEDVRNSTPDEIVVKIMNTKQPRVNLLVEFIDGVRRNNLRRKHTELKQQMMSKQEALKKLLSSKQCLTSHEGTVRPPSDCVIKIDLSSDDIEADTVYSSIQLQDLDISTESKGPQLTIYTGDVLGIVSDVLVVPLGNPLIESSNDSNERIITRLLQAGGDKMINELSLASYCPLGDFIPTSGGKLKGIKSVYHCLFGCNDDHIAKCFVKILEKAASSQKTVGVAFWVDGFFAMNVSPYKILEILKDVTKNIADTSIGTIIIASTAINNLQSLVRDTFKKDESS